MDQHARIEAVIALHRAVDIEPSDTICGECSFQLPNGRYFGKVVEWPCATVELLTAARKATPIDGGLTLRIGTAAKDQPIRERP